MPKIPCDDRRADVGPFDNTVHSDSFSSANIGDVVVVAEIESFAVLLTFKLAKVEDNVGGGEVNLTVDSLNNDKLCGLSFEGRAN